MNLPNAITLCRFFLIPVYVVLFFSGNTEWAFFTVLLAGLSDVLDGYIARKKGLVTPLGMMLDPLADKLMMLTVIGSLLYSRMIPWTAALAILIRDAGMILGSAYFHFRGKKTVPANALGKTTTVLYYVAIVLIVFGFPYAIHYLWFVILFSFLTSAIYILQFKTINQKN